MHYYIDGYNLMYRLLRAGDDLKSSREAVIASLNEKIQLLHLDVTIVFDAQHHPSEGSRSFLKSFEICFTEKGEIADDYILKRIKSSPNPRQETVVTSDSKLAWGARMLLAHTISVEKFIAFINKKRKNFSRDQKGEEQSSIAKQLSNFTATPEPPPKKAPTPPTEKMTEGDLEYYLYHFEQRYKEMCTLEPPQEVKAKRKRQAKKQTKPPKSEEPAVSEFERWLKIFEERDKGSLA